MIAKLIGQKVIESICKLFFSFGLVFIFEKSCKERNKKALK